MTNKMNAAKIFESYTTVSEINSKKNVLAFEEIKHVQRQKEHIVGNIDHKRETF